MHSYNIKHICEAKCLYNYVDCYLKIYYCLLFIGSLFIWSLQYYFIVYINVNHAVNWIHTIPTTVPASISLTVNSIHDHGRRQLDKKLTKICCNLSYSY